jgi:hypothetical protein
VEPGSALTRRKPSASVADAILPTASATSVRGQRGAEVPGIGGVESVVRSIQSPDDLRARDAVLHETETRLALPDRALCLRQVVVVLDRGVPLIP